MMVMFAMVMAAISNVRWRMCSSVLVALVSATDTTETGSVKTSRKRRALRIVASILQRDPKISG